jgi:hypothetical protein
MVKTVAAQEDGRQGRLPIVAMEYLRGTEDLRCLQHRTAVEGEAFSVVGIIAGRRAVEPIPIKEWRVIDEVVLHSLLLAAVQNRAEAVLIVKGNGDARQYDPRVSKPGLLIFGQVDGDGVSQVDECFGECAHNVGESAGFGVRNALRSDKDDVHGTSALELPIKKV